MAKIHSKLKVLMEFIELDRKAQKKAENERGLRENVCFDNDLGLKY